MSKSIKRAIAILICVIIIVIAIVSTFFIVKSIHEKTIIDKVGDDTINYILSNDYIQDNLDNNNVENTTQDELLLQIDGETVLGVIKIEKIGYEGLIYEGTSLETLAKGVGHFEHSPYLERYCMSCCS